MTFFIRTSRLPVHDFESTTFWEPYCTFCHEKLEHPIHHEERGMFEVCGYDRCRHCPKLTEEH